MKANRTAPQVQHWELNFDDAHLNRRRRKLAGYEDPELMDSDDEKRVLHQVEDRSARLNLPIPGLELLGAEIYGRTTQLFGAGHAANPRGANAQQVRSDVHALAVPIAPPGTYRKLFRGGSIEPHEIAGIKRNFRKGEYHPDNYASAYALIHGYVMDNGSRSTERPPSTTTHKPIAENYSRKRTKKAPPHAKQLHITIVAKGSSRSDRHSAKGVTSRFQVAGGGGKREILLDDRNTYRILSFNEFGNGVHVTILADGESPMSELSRIRSNFPSDPASLSRQANLAEPMHTPRAPQPAPYYPMQINSIGREFQPPTTVINLRNRSNSVDAYRVTPGKGTEQVPTQLLRPAYTLPPQMQTSWAHAPIGEHHRYAHARETHHAHTVDAQRLVAYRDEPVTQPRPTRKRKDSALGRLFKSIFS
ncbi:hypothetical protein OH764_33195 (plasmid) [Burkholderia sp. M6-3]